MNKAIFTIKCIKILDNSLKGLISLQKRYLYICCILPIALYGFQLWYYNKAPLDYSLRILRKIQQRAALWIIRAFLTSLILDIEAIASLMPIHFHLKKLQARFHLRGYLLPSNHIIKSIINTDGLNESIAYYHLFLNKLTPKQWSQLYSPLINMDNKCNKFLSSFSPFNKEFSLGKRLINSLLDWFSFHAQTHNINKYIHDLDNITISTFNNLHISMVLLDARIRNNIAIFISHIYSHNKPIIKTIHHVVNVTTTKVKLFAIKCRINQTIGISDIKCIIIVTDSLHATKKIFDISMHPCQIHSTVISQELRDFFKRNGYHIS